jgi:hypothetical protein
LERLYAMFQIRTRIGSGFNQVSGSGSGFGFRIQERKLSAKKKQVKNFMFSSAGCSFLMADGFSCSLIFDPNNIKFFPAVNFSDFGSSKPWNRIRIGIKLKCCIRIRIQLIGSETRLVYACRYSFLSIFPNCKKWLQIHNTAGKDDICTMNREGPMADW